MRAAWAWARHPRTRWWAITLAVPAFYGWLISTALPDLLSKVLLGLSVGALVGTMRGGQALAFRRGWYRGHTEGLMDMVAKMSGATLPTETRLLAHGDPCPPVWEPWNLTPEDLQRFVRDARDGR